MCPNVGIEHSSSSTSMTYQTNSSQTSMFLLMTQHSHTPLTSSLNASRLSCYKGRGKRVQFLNTAHIAEWGKNWLVAFNTTKTQTITITLKHNQVLPSLAMPDAVASYP